MMPLSSQLKPFEGTTDPARQLDSGNSLFRHFRRIVVFILGMSVLVVGVVMIVAPGPAVVVIPLGLGILATEFLWGAADARQTQVPADRCPCCRFTSEPAAVASIRSAKAA